jgi:hypothetical protein
MCCHVDSAYESISRVLDYGAVLITGIEVIANDDLAVGEVFDEGALAHASQAHHGNDDVFIAVGSISKRFLGEKKIQLT